MTEFFTFSLFPQHGQKEKCATTRAVSQQLHHHHHLFLLELFSTSSSWSSWRHLRGEDQLLLSGKKVRAHQIASGHKGGERERGRRKREREEGKVSSCANLQQKATGWELVLLRLRLCPKRETFLEGTGGHHRRNSRRNDARKGRRGRSESIPGHDVAMQQREEQENFIHKFKQWKDMKVRSFPGLKLS